MNDIQKIKEQLRRNKLARKYVYYNWRNFVIMDEILKIYEINKITNFSSISKDEQFIKLLSKDESFKDMKDWKIAMCVENFLIDLLVYDRKVLYTETKGDLHCITGNDGDLMYIFVCSDCGTFIYDDHSAEYQYHCPTMLCPICNKLKHDDNSNKYPFKYITKENPKWKHEAFMHSQYVKKNFLTKQELKEVLKDFTKSWFKQLKIKWSYYKSVKKKWQDIPYFAGTDMSKIHCAFIDGEMK